MGHGRLMEVLVQSTAEAMNQAVHRRLLTGGLHPQPHPPSQKTVYEAEITNACEMAGLGSTVIPLEDLATLLATFAGSPAGTRTPCTPKVYVHSMAW